MQYLIPVSNSRIIEFIKWIKQKHRDEYIYTLDSNSIVKLVEEYLRDNHIEFFYARRRGNLRLIMRLYQSFPMRCSDPIERMFQFCNVKYFNENKWSIKQLNPFLERFINYTSKIGYKSYFEETVYEILRTKNEVSISQALSLVFDTVGDSLLEVFSDYCYQVPRSQLINFRYFINDGIENKIDYDLQVHGLAQAYRELISGEYYDELIAKNDTVGKFLYLTAGVTGDIVQGLTFVEWIYNKYPGINLSGSIPTKIIEQWANEFCVSKGYDNATELSNHIKKLASRNNTSSNFSNRIKSYLKRKAPHLRERDDFLQRYDQVQMHGMFVFAPNHYLSEFIESNWKQFNFILGSDIDVYYSLDDLKGRTDQSIDQYDYFEITLLDLPAFIYWADSLDDHTVISFAGLDDHKDIAEVFEKVVVAGLRNKDTPEMIKNNTSLWIKRCINKRGFEKLISTGGVNMNVFNGGQNFINNGTKMVVKENYIFQENDSSNDKALDTQDIASLRNLINALINCKHEDLSEDLALQGASIFSSLIKASEEKNDDLKKSKIFELKKWKEEIGEKGLKALAIIADVTTLTIPVLHLLGITSS